MRRVIFVFGSNLAGIHGKGDALIARQRHGAILKQGEGLQGDSYGLPTKDRNIRSLPLSEVQKSVERFLAFARSRPDLVFDVQGVGCRLAGFTPEQIAPLFAEAPENCYLHPIFAQVLRAAGQDVQEGPAPRASQGSLAL